MAFQLLIARGNSEGQQFVVVQPVIRIGRDEDNDVVLSDAGVSRQHTRIFENLGRPWVEDLGSANGTLLNGERLGLPRELKTGDALAIGAALINFVEIDDLRRPAPAPDRARALPSVPVASRAVTGDHPALVLTGPHHDEEVITASGEEVRVPWDSGEGRLIDPDDAEVTAPTAKPLFGDDGTQPTGRSLTERKKLEPDGPRTTGPTATGPDPRRPLEPPTEQGVQAQPPPGDPRPGMVSATVLRRVPDLSEQRTAIALPELDSISIPVRDLRSGPRRFPGPTGAAGPTGAQAGPGPSGASFNQLLRADAEASSESLAPLDLSRSDLKALAEPTLSDGQALEDSDPGTRPPHGRPAAASFEDSEPGTRPPHARPAESFEDSDPGTRPPHARPAAESFEDSDPGTLAPAPRHPTLPLAVRETALERSRRRRLANQTLGGQAALWWSELPTRTQAIVTGVCALIVTGVIIGLVQLFRPDPAAALPAEPDRLQVSSERIRYSFGLGDAIDYRRVDGKEFGFDFVTPTEAALLIHYRAEEIDREEVMVIVNGVDVGFVPPDIGVPDREIETLIPQSALKRGEKNTLVFDNVRNPPGSDRWRVGDLSLELLPVPPSTIPEAFKRARDLAKHAGQLYTQRAIGSDNVFRSWKAYRQSWQLLLVVPEEQRSTLFQQTRRKADELGQELDQQCGALMLEAKKQMELKNPDRAKEILLEVTQYFPTGEHRCHALASEKLDEYQL